MKVKASLNVPFIVWNHISGLYSYKTKLDPKGEKSNP